MRQRRETVEPPFGSMKARMGAAHFLSALIPQEHDAITAGEVSRAALDCHVHLIAEITGGPHPHPRSLVESAHLIIGMGEDDPAAIR